MLSSNCGLKPKTSNTIVAKLCSIPNTMLTWLKKLVTIVIHHFCRSRSHQQKTLILLNNLFSSPTVQSKKPPTKNTPSVGRIITSQIPIYPFTKYKILKQPPQILPTYYLNILHIVTELELPQILSIQAP